MQYMDPMGYSMAMILRTEDYIHCNSTTGENQRAPHETSLTSTTATIAPVAIWKKYLHFESGTYILYIYTLFYIYNTINTLRYIEVVFQPTMNKWRVLKVGQLWTSMDVTSKVLSLQFFF